MADAKARGADSPDPGRRGRRAGVRRRCAGHGQGRWPTSADDDMILDIGPQTAARYAALIAKAGTVVWNGPVGVFEFDAFGKGTEDAGAGDRRVARRSPSPAAATRWRRSTSTASTNRIGYISTGGGAFLEFLEGKTLPAFEILAKRAAG